MKLSLPILCPSHAELIYDLTPDATPNVKEICRVLMHMRKQQNCTARANLTERIWAGYLNYGEWDQSVQFKKGMESFRRTFSQVSLPFTAELQVNLLPCSMKNKKQFLLQYLPPIQGCLQPSNSFQPLDVLSLPG